MRTIKQRSIFFLIFAVLHIITLSSQAVNISIPSVSVNTGECFAINVELYKTEEENIQTAVIVFAFDPFKIQIGCENNFSQGTYNEPIVYEPDTTEKETPIVLSESLKDIQIKCRSVIYPQGVMAVVLWDGTDNLPSGTLFTVPCKLTDLAIPGDRLPVLLVSKNEPIYVRRTFSDSHVESQAFYCSLANIEALPVEPILMSGTVYVRMENEGELVEGEGSVLEGIEEGNPFEGTTEGNMEGINEGTNEGTPQEGTQEGVIEGAPEGEKPICGLRNSNVGSITASILIIGIIISLIKIFIT